MSSLSCLQRLSLKKNSQERSSDIPELNSRSPLHILKDRILAIIREVGYYFSFGCSLISPWNSFNKYYSLSLPNSWKKDNQGLYLLIHGLMGHPAIWNGHLAKLHQLHPEAELKAPFVPFKGNCSLEEASKDFLKMIKDYAEKNPGKPICLIGVSNGARIAAYLETRLREETSPKIKVSAIAGPFLGTKAMNNLKKLWIARFLFHSSITRDLEYDSDEAKTLIEDMKKSPFRTHDFYATVNDSRVFPFRSSVPELHRGETHHIVSGYGHSGIVNGVRDQQLETVVEWMKSSSS